MLTKAQIKHLQGLKLKKYRQNYEDFVIEGEKLVTEALLENVYPDLLIATADWLQANRRSIPEAVQVVETSMADIEKISSLSTPQPVLALMKKKEVSINTIDITQKWSLALDGISDPGNFGTILRTADWFGIDTVLCSNDCVDLYNPKVIQSTMGSIFRMSVCYFDLHDYLASCNLPKYAAVLDGEMLDNHIWPEKGVLVIGSESHGISSKVLATCNHAITIPSYGKSESLNAAIATGILLHDIKR